MKKIILCAVAGFFVFYGCAGKESGVSEPVKETVVCDTGENNCSVTCTSGCCLAIYWPDTKGCSTNCDCGNITAIARELDKNTKITLAAKNIKLSVIARAFDNIKGSKVYAPAEKADSPVSVSIKNVTLEKAAKDLGLIIE